MIKTHLSTNIKYLCYTKKEDHENYLGSGTKWLAHLKENGTNIKTEVIFSTTDKKLFKKIAVEKSIEFDIVKSPNWANLIIEQGAGGDTVSKFMWVTNGLEEKYIQKNSIVPEGWKKGRSKNCVFKNSDRQKQFNKMVNNQTKSTSMKECWSSGRFKRDHSLCGKKGEDNPTKRPEVKEKIRQAALKDSKSRSQRMKKVKPWEYTKRNVNYKSSKVK